MLPVCIILSLFTLFTSIQETLGAEESCQNGKGEDYSGTVNKTRSGFECLTWSKFSDSGGPIRYSSVGDHNFCRNPDGDTGVWCFTTNPDVKLFEMCDVPVCEGTQKELVQPWVNTSLLNQPNVAQNPVSSGSESSIRQNGDAFESETSTQSAPRSINCPCLEVEGPPPCSSYSTLDDSWRHIDYEDRVSLPGFCDKPGRGNSYATYTGFVTSWYRFSGASGTKLPTAPAPVGGRPRWNAQVCGSTSTAYISSGGHPTIQDGIVTRDLCWEWGPDSCSHKTTMKVAACKDIYGDYFVYELDPVPRCDNAYCAID